MKPRYRILAAVALLGLVVYPVAVVVTDTTPSQFEDASEDIESYPSADTPWYAVGAMPLLFISGGLMAMLLVVQWLRPENWRLPEGDDE